MVPLAVHTTCGNGSSRPRAAVPNGLMPGVRDRPMLHSPRLPVILEAGQNQSCSKRETDKPSRVKGDTHTAFRRKACAVASFKLV